MSSVAEIEAVLPKLTTEDLHRLEKALHYQYRQRQDPRIYNDAYGTVTESELITDADAAFQEYDKAEALNATRTKR